MEVLVKKPTRIILSIDKDLNNLIESFQDAHSKRLGVRISKHDVLLRVMDRVGKMYLSETTEQYLEQYESYNQNKID